MFHARRLSALSELDIPLVLDKRGQPRDLAFVVCQLGIKVAMCFAVQLHTLVLAIRKALVGIEESKETKYQPYRPSMQTPTCPLPG